MKITQAILPVAGLGTRFLPWTKAVPKELLPLGNQPIIAHLVHECLDVGITDICFVISKGKEAIPQYFKIDPALEEELKKRGKFHLVEELLRYDSVNFHTVYQNEQHGDGHAILQAADWAGKGTIAILFGDDLFTGNKSALRQMIDAHNMLTEDERGAIIALERIPLEDTLRYGIVDVEKEHKSSPRLKKVKGLVEKPEPQFAPSNLGIVGRYLIPRSVIDILPEVESGHGGEIRLIDALTRKLGSLPIYGYECEGTRIDTGHPEGYAKAVSIFSVEEEEE
ncbi:MAG TPA: sugar phosphate nucleotidyltransferase [Candidatus Peribacteraceae bacterium]|nr:sugar phosphate nucleotidyltransferase [Candidatus Peribacteraceae bacterium]